LIRSIAGKGRDVATQCLYVYSLFGLVLSLSFGGTDIPVCACVPQTRMSVPLVKGQN